MSITIGIDARAAAEVPAGRGRVVREVLEALAAFEGDERYRLYCRTPAELKLDDRFEWVTIPAPDPAWHAIAALRASRACDVFWSTNSYLTAWMTRVPTVVSVYDLIAFMPGAHAQARAARIERLTIGRAIRRAAAILCNSQSAVQDLVARHADAAGRVVTIPLAAGERFSGDRHDLAAVRSRYELDRPFVLTVGTLEPRKNLLRLIDAWTTLDVDYELLLVGPTGWEVEQLVERARSARVRVVGHVSDDYLAALYRLCALFCYPSLYEGFGLPVLEAMAAGAPVITSDISSLPEVAGGAALLVDPHSEVSIAAAIQRVLSDTALRQNLRERGQARAAEFTWARTAGEIRQLLLSASTRS